MLPTIFWFIWLSISVHLAKWFQKRRFLEIGQPEKELPVAAMFVNQSRRNEQVS
jgi:hypothetical protein